MYVYNVTADWVTINRAARLFQMSPWHCNYFPFSVNQFPQLTPLLQTQNSSFTSLTGSLWYGSAVSTRRVTVSVQFLQSQLSEWCAFWKSRWCTFKLSSKKYKTVSTALIQCWYTSSQGRSNRILTLTRQKSGFRIAQNVEESLRTKRLPRSQQQHRGTHYLIAAISVQGKSGKPWIHISQLWKDQHA